MPAYRDSNAYDNGLNFGINPASPSGLLRKRQRGKNENQLDEDKVNQMVLGQYAREGMTNAENGPGIVGLPREDQANVVGDSEKSGEPDQIGPVAGMKGTVPEKNKIDKRLLALIAKRAR